MVPEGLHIDRRVDKKSIMTGLERPAPHYSRIRHLANVDPVAIFYASTAIDVCTFYQPSSVEGAGVGFVVLGVNRVESSIKKAAPGSIAKVRDYRPNDSDIDIVSRDRRIRCDCSPIGMVKREILKQHVRRVAS